MRHYIIFLTLLYFTSHLNWAQNLLQQEFKQAFLELAARDEHKRKVAAQKITAIGERAVPVLIRYFAHASYLGKRHIVKILGEINTPQARRFLIQTLQNPDAGVRYHSALALLQIADSMADLEERLKKLSVSGKVKATVEDLLETLRYKKVEKLLLDLISQQGNYTFHEKQFAALKKRGTEVVPILLEIFSTERYHFTHMALNYQPEIAYKLRLLACYSLSFLHEKLSHLERARVLSALRKFRYHRSSKVREMVACTLYNLDDRSYFEMKVIQQKQAIRRKANDAGAHFELGMLYFKVGKHRRAIRYLEKAVAIDPYHANAYYYLASCYVERDRLEKALEALTLALRNGFQDVQWLEQDKSFDKIASDPRFQGLLQQLRLGN